MCSTRCQVRTLRDFMLPFVFTFWIAPPTYTASYFIRFRSITCVVKKYPQMG